MREATGGDEAAVLELSSKEDPTNQQRLLRPLSGTSGGVILVAESTLGRTPGASLVVGAAFVSRPERSSRAAPVAAGVLVPQAWQRRGVGSALLSAVTRQARAHGADTVVLTAQPGNDAALRTVGRCGLTARLSRVDDEVEIRIPLVRSSRSGAYPDSP